MKFSYFTTFCLVFSVHLAFGQDRVILINGDTLKGKVIKIGQRGITILDGTLELELSSNLTNKLVLETGKQTIFREIPRSLDFGTKFSVMEFSNDLASEIATTFPGAIKKEFRKNFSEYEFSGALPIEYYTEDNPAGIGKDERRVIDHFRFIGFACNAFIGLVSMTENGYKYVFYSNPVRGETVSNSILNNSYKLTSSNSSNALLGIVDILATNIKPFTMTFRPNSECIFIEDKKTTMLEYTIEKNGSISFRDPKKNKEVTIYQVVFIDDNYMRYTQFSSGRSLITRQVDLVR